MYWCNRATVVLQSAQLCQVLVRINGEFRPHYGDLRSQRKSSNYNVWSVSNHQATILMILEWFIPPLQILKSSVQTYRMSCLSRWTSTSSPDVLGHGVRHSHRHSDTSRWINEVTHISWVSVSFSLPQEDSDPQVHESLSIENTLWASTVVASGEWTTAFIPGPLWTSSSTSDCSCC